MRDKDDGNILIAMKFFIFLHLCVKAISPMERISSTKKISGCSVEMTGKPRLAYIPGDCCVILASGCLFRFPGSWGGSRGGFFSRSRMCSPPLAAIASQRGHVRSAGDPKDCFFQI